MSLPIDLHPKTIGRIFMQAIEDYHKEDNVNAVASNPYPEESFSYLLYKKNWIDTLQWHWEDLIRDAHIAPEKALFIKRKIDALNQARTDMVEYIEDKLYSMMPRIPPLPTARLNTETIGWAIDRFSILCLKIYHMKIEVLREDAGEVHQKSCMHKLHILQEQQSFLIQAILELMEDIQAGKVHFHLYRQMKMYNDPTLNPILYQKNNVPYKG